jgi:hypothetical protein
MKWHRFGRRRNTCARTNRQISITEYRQVPDCSSSYRRAGAGVALQYDICCRIYAICSAKRYRRRGARAKASSNWFSIVFQRPREATRPNGADDRCQKVKDLRGSSTEASSCVQTKRPSDRRHNICALDRRRESHVRERHSSNNELVARCTRSRSAYGMHLELENSGGTARFATSHHRTDELEF